MTVPFYKKYRIILTYFPSTKLNSYFWNLQFSIFYVKKPKRKLSFFSDLQGSDDICASYWKNRLVAYRNVWFLAVCLTVYLDLLYCLSVSLSYCLCVCLLVNNNNNNNYNNKY